MASFDRYDICCAYAALEYDWGDGGWVRERPSNQRRRESIGVQLHRMNFRPAQDEAAGFAHLLKHDAPVNRAEIYVEALVRFGMAPLVHSNHEEHADIVGFLHKAYDPEWIASHFPNATKAPRERATG